MVYVNPTLISAKAAFGKTQPNLFASDYIAIKKQKVLGYSGKINGTKLYNPANLNYNLFTKENLFRVNTLYNKNQYHYVNPSIQPFFQYNYIDPLGELFGNSQCGINNFTSYMQLNVCDLKY